MQAAEAQGSTAINVQLSLNDTMLIATERCYHGLKLRVLWLRLTAGRGGAGQRRHERAAVA
jgi:hypothetical protein